MDAATSLVLGPMLRYADETTATVWVETAAAGEVTVLSEPRSWSSRTFAVEGHHYALVVIDGLEPVSSLEYEVAVDGQVVWPPPDSPFPPPVIRTIDRTRPTRLAYGSCRTSVPHDRRGNESNGVDALRALALAVAGGRAELPDLIAFLGDQVYADLTSEAMREWIAERRSLAEPPGEEIKDYEEYAHLYRLAWTDPANRWLLSTVPSCMIFDDHDIRDDWNTSWTWHEQINRTSWWHERLVGGLASYWVYQHIGNLSPEALEADEVYALVLAGDGSGEVDVTDAVRDLASRVDRHPDVYRWSYVRDFGDSKLVVVDSRAARVLEPDRRSMLDPVELAWLDSELVGDVDHLLVGTSLPFLLPPGLHDFEAIDEVLASGPLRSHRLSRPISVAAERLRQSIDLEHWAAFSDGFAEVFEMVMAVARGERGRPPATITFLSGDVHNSYVAEVEDVARHGGRSRIVQAVCSPIRNPMPRGLRIFMSAFAKGLVGPMRWIASRSSRIPDPAYPWRVTDGPWFDNCIGELVVHGADLELTWRRGEVPPGEEHPQLVPVATVRLAGIAQPVS
ncbi:alkaline phosphatase family protein [Intrasporangium calvum]|uniref:Alkaline phosphatase family protein n=1 Tax=Intrasporangium calvum TaxID=53358 RepID=A0ABT5GI49_9MICO|nr:alkaline phosphatase D family protein [Intrasporangium calvum]MDC5697575.1 alkaline phosphatase family protein [Intrasporangium calvum]